MIQIDDGNGKHIVVRIILFYCGGMSTGFLCKSRF